MADENDDEMTEGEGNIEPAKAMTLEEAMAKIADQDASIARLTSASTKASKDAQKLREAEDTRKAERKRLEREGLSEPEKLAAKLREAETEKDQFARERDEALQGRIDDSNERAILLQASKHLSDDHIDLAWERIDRSLLTFGDDGKITGGIDKALEKLAKDRPSWAKVKAKPIVKGSGVRNPNSASEGNRQPENFFLNSSRNSTINPL